MNRLEDVAPALHLMLTRGPEVSRPGPRSDIHCETLWVAMRDAVRLATDLYLPPRRPAPAIAIRTPYGRARRIELIEAFVRQGYAVISQDCRGTGDSEPGTWDYSIYEPEDGLDLVEWVVRQPWFDGFIGGCGGSYAAQTQWCMGAHPRMSTIVPEVGGLGVAFNTVAYYMFLNAHARSVGKGVSKISVPFSELECLMIKETLAGGFFNEPLLAEIPNAVLARYPDLEDLSSVDRKRGLWERYCSLEPAQRAELMKLILGAHELTFIEMESLASFFGHRIAYGAHAVPSAEPAALARKIHAPALMITGWYDWGLNDTLATWELLKREGNQVARSRSRLLIAPSAHNTPGYHEGSEDRPELGRSFRSADSADLLLHWYGAMRDETTASWPAVIYYLMGANEWRVASDWPPVEACKRVLYLTSGGALTSDPPQVEASDHFTYDPAEPTPTVGGSIVSYVYPPGSADVSEVQKRSDVVTFTTSPLERNLDVIGPLQVILYASSSAVDTDFAARLSDVFPDGRAIQLQSGILRARFRDRNGEAGLLKPGRAYRFTIDLWATANRFEAGHRLRLDVSSADFPRFDRNANLGGRSGKPIPAMQTIFHGPGHPSQLILSVLEPP